MSVLSVLSESSVLSARSYRSVLKAGQQKKAKKPVKNGKKSINLMPFGYVLKTTFPMRNTKSFINI